MALLKHGEKTFGRKRRNQEGVRSMRERVSPDNVMETLTGPAQFRF